MNCRSIRPGSALALIVSSSVLAAMLATVQASVSEQAKLTASDASANDYFGHAVANSGETALVGAFGDDDAGVFSGSAYVFVRGADGWSEQAKLTSSDAAAYDYFGYSVALAGETAVVGAYGENDRGSNAGAVYVFTRSGTVWSEQAKLTASDGDDEAGFGCSVALSEETVIVGACRDNQAGQHAGSAYVFTRSGTSWSEQAKLMAGDGAPDDEFGFAVALSGETAVVSAIFRDDGGADSGAAYVFVRSGTTWSEQAKLTPAGVSAYDHFGRSVALSDDTALIGAHLDDDAGTSAGSTYVFVRSGTSWSEQDKLTASDTAGGDYFGLAVALSGDTALVGAYQHDEPGFDSGSAYVFGRDGATWTERQKLTASDAAVCDYLGYAVAFSDEIALVGAYGRDDAGAHSGSAYVYDLTNAPPVALCRDVTVEADADCLGVVSPEELDDGSYDPDGDPITLGLDPPGPYPLGETSTTLTVTDDRGAVDTCTATVSVVDVAPPSLSASLAPQTLWPPNHRMVDVAASVVAADNCDVPAVILLSVASSEPDDAPGTGDGHTIDDIQHAEAGTADFDFALRAERAGTGDGREYTATYLATDLSDNETAAASEVRVPHDRGGATEPLIATLGDDVAGTVLSWAVVEDAAHYNVIRGELASIAETPSAIDLGAVVCIEHHSLDETTQGWDDPEIPLPGEAFFYLAEYDNGTRSSYGTESAPKPRVVPAGDCE